MNTSIAAGSLLAALVLAVPVQGQQVTANVVVRSGPVAGHVVIGDGYSTYRRPLVVYRREPARVIVIERVHLGQFRDRQWRNNYRPLVVYYFDGRYYDRAVPGRPMREIVVYERNGRYYQEDDQRHERDEGRYNGRDRDDDEHRDWD